MGVYTKGTAVTITETFRVNGVLANPTTVVFRLRNPADAICEFTSGVDPEVQNPSTGVWTLTFTPALAGTYRYQAIGTGAVTAVSPDGEFEVTDSAIETPPPDGPLPGPCTQWITGQDVLVFLPDGVIADQADDAAAAAGLALYEISGRRFSGLCSRTVRPVSQPCSCWLGASGNWWWAWMGGFTTGAGSWYWRNDLNDRLGCTPVSRVRLPGYPIREIDTVKIDGAILDPIDTNGNPTYRLDERKYLTRLNDPTQPNARQMWPGCQNMAIEDDQPGTFSVAYKCGIDPPQLGRDAAAQLAAELFKATTPGMGACTLPIGATSVTRQGVRVERGVLANWFDDTKSTGLVYLDLFLRAYWSLGKKRQAAVWSPDVAGYARRFT